MQVSQLIDGVPQKGERCIFDVEDNPRAGIFSLDHQRRIHPAHSEEGCFRLLLNRSPIARPSSLQRSNFAVQISDFEPQRMQHAPAPTFLYNSERWLARAPEKQPLPM
jgi:hypothetical protein